MADLWSTTSPRGVGRAHVDDRGYRFGAHAGNPASERLRAARVVASRAYDADECAALLAMLGLSVQDGLSSERPS